MFSSLGGSISHPTPNRQDAAFENVNIHESRCLTWDVAGMEQQLDKSSFGLEGVVSSNLYLL